MSRILACVLFFLFGTAAFAEDDEGPPLVHNGSIMDIVPGEGGAFDIVYIDPRPGLSVQRGTVVFEGVSTAEGATSGTAYVFKAGCEPLPYQVKGSWQEWKLVLKGAAPVRHKNSCKQKGLAWNSNSTLVFIYAH